MFEIEVAFASPNLQKIVKLQVTETCTITEAIAASGLAEVFPDYDLTCLPVGIFGKRLYQPDNYTFKPGDRLEIYRPLAKSPNQKRLERAKNN